MDKKQTHLLITGILSIGLCMLLAGCENADAVTEATEDESSITIPVETQLVSRGTISSTYSTTAILEAQQEAFVVARASGIIESIAVEEGDYVEKGQVLAQLDRRRYELNLLKANADLAGIEQELAKINQVYSRKLVSDDVYEKLSATFEAAKANVELAKLDLQETTITAPISGYIAERNAKVGNLTESFQRERMFHIVQQNTLQGIVYLPESELPHINVKQQATLTLLALNNETVTAVVSRISPVIDATTGTFKVTLNVPNSHGTLKAGMFSEVALNYATHENTTLLPRQALISIDNENTVFVVRDGKAQKVPVILGFEQGDMVEITSGLIGSETVITYGHQNLKDQTPVDIVNG
ncbi:efflux RND transporter periplasmic adaptor subunit [Alteromonas sp. C1M14]|uniref:efflux RND transporter periplasmic adaptor subunit n=1 Tax=Alteromonas sp. C1M14 TaxID=2841567 RepID=UPI001C09DDC5|nr:efflux RND transporter periplasmic adaptor subunit [Alteromonas sp. C1M14]MBU2976741.1 efflux RND transporter periplasmic adaptor subunit [Alteromonas sp. C1M14]